MSLDALAKRYKEAALDFAWREFEGVGLSSVQRHQGSTEDWCKDPEALILFGLVCGRDDPRLFDEILDWTCLNADLISFQRLSNLSKSWPATARSLARAAAIMVKARPSRGIAAHALEKGPPGARPVFPGIPLEAGVDSIFAGEGWLRPPFRRSGKALRPKFSDPRNLAFRLRLAFGPGTRSEVARFLFLHSIPGDPTRGVQTARVARAAGFAKRNVQDTLRALADAEICISRPEGNEVIWSIDLERWESWLDPEKTYRGTYWLDWPSILQGLGILYQFFADRPWAEVSEYLAASKARQVFKQARSAIYGLPAWHPPDPEAFAGTAFLPPFEASVDELILRPLTDISISAARRNETRGYPPGSNPPK